MTNLSTATRVSGTRNVQSKIVFSYAMTIMDERLLRTLETQAINIAKYHETVNMAIAQAVSRPFGGEHTHRGRAC